MKRQHLTAVLTAALTMAALAGCTGSSDHAAGPNITRRAPTPPSASAAASGSSSVEPSSGAVPRSNTMSTCTAMDSSGLSDTDIERVLAQGPAATKALFHARFVVPIERLGDHATDPQLAAALHDMARLVDAKLTHYQPVHTIAEFEQQVSSPAYKKARLRYIARCS